MFALPVLPYDYSALEPYIDKETMRIHHSKHHQGYIDKLNQALEGEKALVEKSVEDILKNLTLVPEAKRTVVKDMAGGHANHSLFWQIMSASPLPPQGKLKEAIDKEFASLGKFTEVFSEAALKVFGSGWTFLVVSSGKLSIESFSNQDSPLAANKIPLLGIDVWEHAYYLKYQNRRADYIKAWFNVLSFKEASDVFTNLTEV